MTVALVTGEISGLIALDFDRGAGVEMMRHIGVEPHVRDQVAAVLVAQREHIVTVSATV